MRVLDVVLRAVATVRSLEVADRLANTAVMPIKTIVKLIIALKFF